jgi:hypothetical protein
MKKNVSAPNDDAIDRCYSQAANAAAAALDIQAQLFNKLKESCSLQPPPVVAFTCVGPVVKVWHAYQDKSQSLASPIQVRTIQLCLFSTLILSSVWSVSGLRQ